jgi:hypothetical protein
MVVWQVRRNRPDQTFDVLSVHTKRSDAEIEAARVNSAGGWVTCSPGDPNDKQLEFANKMARDRPFCIYLFNADTGTVRVRFDGDRLSGAEEIDVDTDGHEVVA